jgi:CheY-like chemotaxis protein
MLKKMGCDVTPVPDGKDAVLAFMSNEFDCIIMDCVMPEIDGYEATQKIRKMESLRGGSTPIIALTANVIIENKTRCLECGMNDFIPKPVKLKTLQEVLYRQFREQQ